MHKCIRSFRQKVQILRANISVTYFVRVQLEFSVADTRCENLKRIWSFRRRHFGELYDAKTKWWRSMCSLVLVAVIFECAWTILILPLRMRKECSGPHNVFRDLYLKVTVAWACSSVSIFSNEFFYCIIEVPYLLEEEGCQMEANVATVCSCMAGVFCISSFAVLQG